MSDKTESQSGVDMASGTGGANVDQIREIIFGGQMRDYDKRFSRLEETLLKEVAGIRNDTNSRLDALETFMKAELDALNENISHEKTTRESGDKRLDKELDSLGQQLTATATEIKDQMHKGQREIREQLLDQAKTMNADLLKAREELSQAIERAQNELGGDKADRAALASLFTEMAMRLNGDFELPGDA